MADTGQVDQFPEMGQPEEHAMPSLFKYISTVSALNFLLKGSVKFTPIAELNDPTELFPNVIRQEIEQSLQLLRRVGYSDDDMKHLRRQGTLLQRLAPEFQAVPVPDRKEDATKLIRSSFFDNLPLLEYLLAQTAETISSRVGLFCLTKRYDVLPMWAHYAGNANGLVVEFSNLNKTFKGDETGILSQPRPVRYERERLGVSFDPRSHDSIFFSKFEDWRYEEEIRIVMPLSDCRLATIDSQRVYLFDVPDLHVSRIILGWRMSEAAIEEVIEIVQSVRPSTEVVRAAIEGGKVRWNGHLHN